ncbi:MAG: two-component sensor histidine kinase [Rubrivivax sp.]|nr:two-component sensor histidine kinase [Rubrivivax sp.]
MATEPLVPPVARRAAGGRLSRFAVGFTALFLLLAWVLVVALLQVQRRGEIEGEARQNLNVARALEEQTLRVLSATDQATMRLRDVVLARPGTVPEMASIANETGMAPRILVQLALVDAGGRFVGSNLDPDGSKTGHVDLSEREHVRVHLAPGKVASDTPPVSPGGLFIGKPVLGKVSKKWTIQVSRKIADAEGRALGVVVASLDPAYFDDVFKRVQSGRQGSVALVGTDRTLRARVMGGQSAGMGSKISEASPIAGPAPAAEGHYQTISGVDGIERLVAYRRVADYPFYVLVASGADEALAPWRATRNLTLGVLLLLSVGGVVSATGLVLGLRRLERTNQALRLREAQAQAANQAKTEFLAAISHELRTPLTSIRGFAELMEHRLDSPKYRELSGLIRKGAEHLNDLLTEILDLAKTEAGAMVLSPGRVELRPLVNEAAEFFRLAAANKGLALRADLAPELPDAMWGDGQRLRQILHNLLSNAVKFTPEGSIQIAVSADAGRVRFEVRDTGPGIPPEKQALIFEKFRQGDAHVSYEHGGTGLGLALSRGLAELMGGTLTVRSAPGQGATFTLDVPRGEPPAT